MKLAREKESVYFSDMGRCLPAKNLSSGGGDNHWRLIKYHTGRDYASIKGLYLMKQDARCAKAYFAGTAVESPSAAGGCEISYPLEARGWHAVFAAITGEGKVKIKFSGDSGFTTFRKASPDWKGYEEAIVGFRKLDGESLVFSPAPQNQEKSAVIAYIKIVPLTPEEIKEHSRRFSAKERIITGTRDQAGWYDGNDTERKMADAVFNQLADSPVGTLYLGMPSCGCILNYENMVLKGKRTDCGWKEFSADTVRRFLLRGESPLGIAVKLAHRAGLKIHFFQRPGRFHDPGTGLTNLFYAENPGWRLKNKNGGDILGRMSVAFPEVRRYLADCLRETLKYGPDGVNICLIRGAPLALYESPILEEFNEKYHDDPSKLRADDERLIELRCKYTTQYIREVREMLDEEGRRRKKKFQLSVMVFGDRKTNRHIGLDIEKWIELSLVDIVSPWHVPVWWPPTIIGKTADLDYWASLRSNKTKIVPFIRYRWEDAARLADKAYSKGFSEFAFWDIDVEMDESRRWQTLKRIVSHESARSIKPDDWLPRVGYFEVFDDFGWDIDFGPFGSG